MRKVREGEGESRRMRLKIMSPRVVERPFRIGVLRVKWLAQLLGGFWQSGMSYTDHTRLDELYENVVFVRITDVGLAESRPPRRGSDVTCPSRMSSRGAKRGSTPSCLHCVFFGVFFQGPVWRSLL